MQLGHTSLRGALVAFGAAFALIVAAGAADARPKPGAKPKKPLRDATTILVRFKSGATRVDEKVRANGDAVVAETATKVKIVRVEKGETLDAKIAEYKRRADVEYAEPNYIATTDVAAPNDPMYGSQYGLTAMNMVAAWTTFPGVFTSSGSVPIAVVDTGVQATHPDLVGKVNSGAGANCSSSSSICSAWPGNSFDDDGHGTHVAGIAAAMTNNGVGIAGVSVGSPIIPVKVLGGDGTGTYAAIINGITWARTHGAKVINLSLGAYAYSAALCGAVSQAVSAGIVVVGAAGNDGDNTPFYPAACPGAVAVGATDQWDDSPAFSNWDYPNVFVSAPGDQILSTIPFSTYDWLTGTSMAAPHVAGLAALVASHEPRYSGADIKRVLAKTADRVGAPFDYYGIPYGGDTVRGPNPFNACRTCLWHPYWGYGRVDGEAAVLGAQPTIAAVAPTSSKTGANVTVTGEDFLDASAVTVGGHAATFNVTNATSLTATVPALAAQGPIQVTTPRGTATSSFSLSIVPTVSGFSPSTGLAGAEIEITGTGWPPSGATAVSFNGVAATFTQDVVAERFLLRAIVPPTATTGKVRVTFGSVFADSTTSFNVPRVTSFAPAIAVPGTLVTVYGNGLGDVSEVRFNGVGVPPSFVSATSVRATVPFATTTGPLSVVTPAGEITAATPFKVLPKVTSFSPPDGQGGVTEITIQGGGFRGTPTVKVGVLAATGVALDSATQVRATVPAGATSGLVSVTTPDGTATSIASFAVTRVTSLFPAQATAGTLVSINGTGLGTTTGVTINGTAAPIVGTPTAALVKVTVPNGATTGTLELTTPRAVVTAPTAFKVLPKITALTPADGVPGTDVTIAGSGFRGVPVVKFGLVAVAPADVSLVSSEELHVPVPATATVGKVTVQTPDGIATSVADFAVPKVTLISPLQAAGGATVTINGVGLGRTSAVQFSGASAPTVPAFVSPTSVRAVVPNDATTGALTVVTPTTDLTTAVLKVLPRIVSFAPLAGLAGSTVTITGSALDGATSVKFGLAVAPIVSNTRTEIVTTVPAAATTGRITVTTPGGTVTSAVDFGITRIISVLPAQATAGTVVTISGTGLVTTSGVTINGANAPLVGAPTAASVRVTVPNDATTGALLLSTPEGVVSAPAPFKVLPKITALSPADGVPGTEVAIEGSGFRGTPPLVKFGLVAVAPGDVNLVSSQELRVPVPAGATVGKVTVQTPDGLATSVADFAVPKVTSLLPTLATTGTTLTINGVGLGRTTAVQFAGAASPTVPASVTPTAVRVVVPSDAITGALTLDTPTAALVTASFKVLPKLAASPFSEPDGAPGTTIQINGSGLDGATAVKFGLVSASILANTQNQVTTVVPATAATATVSVTTPSGTVTSATPFQVPKLTSFLPASGFAGTAVTFSGTGLGRTSAVQFSGASGPVSVAPSLVSAGSVRANVPPTAVTGPVTLVTPTTDLTSASFKVPPKVDSISPASGPATTPVTITGSGLGDATTVRFGTVDLAPSAYTIDSATQITAHVPTPPSAGAANGKITVITPSGTAQSVQTFTVNFAPLVTDV